MQDQKKQLIDTLKKANNVLVTVSNNPSVDEFAACIGLTLALNKLKKHATAVYSGDTPSTIEFLQPEDTLERNTDSLRDFIISLDKAKADKLKYKVEDSVVRIFITPYKASISDADLEFSQGDFNVDVVVAIGVRQQQDLDQAITSHGRIFHDAKVITVNQGEPAELGTINWLDNEASSLSELISGVANSLSSEVLDEQIATAFLTGIVAQTERFSNEKTTANTMKASAVLMAAGANQQLVATKLNQPDTEAAPLPLDDVQEFAAADQPAEPEAETAADGTLQINHSQADDEAGKAAETDVPAVPADDPVQLAEPVEPVVDNFEDPTPPATSQDDGGYESLSGEPVSRKFVGSPSGEDSQIRAESQQSVSFTEEANQPSGQGPVLPPQAPAAPERKVIQPLPPAEPAIPAPAPSPAPAPTPPAPAATPAKPAPVALPEVPQTLEELEKALGGKQGSQPQPAPAAAFPKPAKRGANSEDHHTELDLSLLQTPEGVSLPQPQAPMGDQPATNAAPPVPPPIIPPNFPPNQ